jgi:prophage regulatory protein
MSTNTATPVKRVLDHKALLERVPISRTTLWRMERAGDFPRRIQISAHRVGWFEAEVDAWLDGRKLPTEGTNTSARVYQEPPCEMCVE